MHVLQKPHRSLQSQVSAVLQAVYEVLFFETCHCVSLHWITVIGLSTAARCPLLISLMRWLLLPFLFLINLSYSLSRAKRSNVDNSWSTLLLFSFKIEHFQHTMKSFEWHICVDGRSSTMAVGLPFSPKTVTCLEVLAEEWKIRVWKHKRNAFLKVYSELVD
jgi:hypothetical protein